jgi:hypothetical protein
MLILLDFGSSYTFISSTLAT